MILLVVVLSILLLFLVMVGASSAVTLQRRRLGRRGGETAESFTDAQAPPSQADEPVGSLEAEEFDPDLIARVEEAFVSRVLEAPPEAVPEAPPEPEPVPEAPPEPVPEPVAGPPRLRDRLGKARALFAGRIGAVVGKARIDASSWEDLEEALVLADVGVARTAAMIERLRVRVKGGEIHTPDELVAGLKADLKVDMAKGDHALHMSPGPVNVWLFVGVNGVGKTTTIGKVAMRETAAGRSVVMAAGDTFRAAAAEQLELWAQRVGADLVRGAEGGDPGSVVFDAVQRAAARGAELVLADTAGRLHTKVNLMEELKKVRRIAERPPGQLSEVLLVIDATTGQNGLIQARQFTEAVGVTGIVLTKLDGTAKGGIVLAIQGELGLPIKLVGLGESADDLIDFDPDDFVDALFE